MLVGERMRLDRRRARPSGRVCCGSCYRLPLQCPFHDRGDSSPTAGWVDRSADLVGEPCERWNRTQNESCGADVANHGGFICPVDLATQSTHMNIDKIRFRNEFVVPYVFEEGCARQQLVDPLHHVLEQMELARPQIDRPVATLRGPLDEIEFQWSHAQYRFIRLGLRVGIRREIMKLIHRSFPVPVASRFCTRSPDSLLAPAPNASETNCSIATELSFITEMVGGPDTLV